MSDEVEETSLEMAERLFGDKAEESAPEPEVEVQDEQEVEQELPEQAEEPVQSDPPKPDTADLMDKELQRVQQLRATLEREVGKLEKNPSEAQADRVEKAKSKLDKYLEASDVDPYQGVTDIASEVQADRGRVERLLQEHEAMKRTMAEQNAQREAKMARLQFAVDYPGLAGRYQEFQQKAHEAVVEIFGDRAYEMDPRDYGAVANKEFMSLVKSAKDETAVTEEKAKPVPKKPRGTHIIKKPSGNSAKPNVEDTAAEMAKIRAKWGS